MAIDILAMDGISEGMELLNSHSRHILWVCGRWNLDLILL